MTVLTPQQLEALELLHKPGINAVGVQSVLARFGFKARQPMHPNYAVYSRGEADVLVPLDPSKGGHDELLDRAKQAVVRLVFPEVVLALLGLVQRQQRENAVLSDALRLITRGGCESFTTEIGSCLRWGRTIDAKYLADRACMPCIANAALERS